MVATTIGNDPLIQADNVQHYAYRAVEAGLNTFESVINNNPNLAHCDSTLNASPLCTGLQYQVWNDVLGTTGTNGVIPEYYLVDNPQPQIAANGTLTSLNVEIIGAAGYPGRFVYQTIDGRVPADQRVSGQCLVVRLRRLEPRWNGHGIPAHQVHHRVPMPVTTRAKRRAVLVHLADEHYPGSLHADQQRDQRSPRGDIGPCGTGAPPFTSGDTINGPLYSNDSIKVSNNPNFGIPWPAPPPPGSPQVVTTADPALPIRRCRDLQLQQRRRRVQPQQYLQPSHRTVTGRRRALQTIASVGGCLYQGPTQITLVGNQMNVISPDTPASPGPGRQLPQPGRGRRDVDRYDRIAPGERGRLRADRLGCQQEDRRQSVRRQRKPVSVGQRQVRPDAPVVQRLL